MTETQAALQHCKSQREGPQGSNIRDRNDKGQANMQNRENQLSLCGEGGTKDAMHKDTSALQGRDIKG